MGAFDGIERRAIVATRAMLKSWGPKLQMKTSTSRSVLVTGGTGSVGESLVTGFVTAGYRVSFVFGRSESRAAELSQQLGASAIKVDLAGPIQLAESSFDILVNNAGINESAELTGDVRLEDWTKTISVNLTAPFLLSQQCLPHMVNNRWGRIINISSIYGCRAVEGNLPYTVSKYGLSGLTKTIAREYGHHGITCNEICPGPIESRLLDRICAERSAREGMDLDDYVQEVKEEIPTQQLVQPREVTQMALLLASDQCASINGASIIIDGGMTV